MSSINEAPRISDCTEHAFKIHSPQKAINSNISFPEINFFNFQACDLILKLKTAEDPSSDLAKAKKIYQETSDSKKAYEELNESKNKCVEAKLLYGLSIHGENDYVNALEEVRFTI